MDQLLNELSVSGRHVDKYAADAAMLDLCEASDALCRIGYGNAVKTPRDFANMALAPDYPVRKWFVDRDLPQENRDRRRLFLTRCTKAPYLEELHQEADIQDIEEFRFQEKAALGLTLAHLWGCPALSLAGDERFPANTVMLSWRRFTEREEWEEREFPVPLLRCRADVERGAEEFCNALPSPELRTGRAVLAHAPQVFPSLVFSRNAEGQIRRLSGGEIYFPEIVRHLKELDKAMRRGDAEFQPSDIDYAPTESGATSRNPQCRAARTFRFPDGRERICLAHSKIHTAYRRIYVFPDMEDRVVYVGHAGEHLPLAGD